MPPLGVALLTVAPHGQALQARLLLGALTGAILYGTTLGWLSGFGDPALLRETVPLRTGLTPYACTGDLPVLGLALLALILPALLRRER